jgi:sugar phosphate isomerase/epimerase
VIGRREFIGALAASAVRFKGVRLGIGTFSYRGLKLDEVARIVHSAGSPGVELEASSLGSDDPAGARKQLRVYAFNAPIPEKLTDAEIEAVVLKTKALGAAILNTTTTLPTAKRIAPFAAKHKVRVGLHSGGGIGSGASYLEGFGISPWINANIDLYAWKNLGPDPLAFIREHHQRITSIHFHDRKGSAFVPFGQGELPTRELLLMARNERFDFTFSIERTYNVPNIDHAAETRRNLDYCKNILAG